MMLTFALLDDHGDVCAEGVQWPDGRVTVWHAGLLRQFPNLPVMEDAVRADGSAQMRVPYPSAILPETAEIRPWMRGAQQ